MTARAGGGLRAAVAAWISFAGAAAATSCDPVHDDARAALGPEAPLVSTGPLHRPGQPCLVCHDGAIGDPPAFSVAGTVYQSDGSQTPLASATVGLTDKNGATYSATTNAAGNFYVTPYDFTPVYPLRVSVTSAGKTTTMVSHIGRDGSCAGCHADPAGPGSPGHVYWDAPAGAVP